MTEVLARLNCNGREDLLTLGKEALPHLWKDEIGTPFIITRHCEIYAYGSNTLGVYCWNRNAYLQMHKTGLIFDVCRTGDNCTALKLIGGI